MTRPWTTGSLWRWGLLLPPLLLQQLLLQQLLRLCCGVLSPSTASVCMQCSPEKAALVCDGSMPSAPPQPPHQDKPSSDKYMQVVRGLDAMHVYADRCGSAGHARLFAQIQPTQA